MNILVSVTKPELSLHYNIDIVIILAALRKGHNVYVYVCNGLSSGCPNRYYLESMGSSIEELDRWARSCLKETEICKACCHSFLESLQAMQDGLSPCQGQRLTMLEGQLDQKVLPVAEEDVIIDRLRGMISTDNIEYIGDSLLLSSIIPEALGITGATLVDLRKNQFDRVLRLMLRRAIYLEKIYREIVTEYKIDRVFTFNGRFLASKLMVGLCKELGIEVTTHERGIADGTFVFNKNRSVDETFAVELYASDETIRETMELSDFWESCAVLSSKVARRLPKNRVNIADSNQRIICFALQSTDEVSISGGLAHDWWDYQFRLGTALAQEALINESLQIIFCVHPRSIRSIRLSRSFAGRWSEFIQGIELLRGASNGRIVINLPWVDGDSFLCFERATVIVALYSTAAIESSLLGRVLVTHDASRFSHLGEVVLSGDNCDEHLMQIQDATLYESASLKKKNEAIKTYYASYLSRSKTIIGYEYSWSPNSLQLSLDTESACEDGIILSLI